MAALGLTRNDFAEVRELSPAAQNRAFCADELDVIVYSVGHPNGLIRDAAAQEQLRSMVRTFAPALADADVVAAQACYRPVTRDGLPVMGRVPGLERAHVATGHSVWGMLNAPATGEAMAEFITEGEASVVDISAFDPARLPALRRDTIRA